MISYQMGGHYQLHFNRGGNWGSEELHKLFKVMWGYVDNTVVDIQTKICFITKPVPSLANNFQVF